MPTIIKNLNNESWEEVFCYLKTYNQTWNNKIL